MQLFVTAVSDELTLASGFLWHQACKINVTQTYMQAKHPFIKLKTATTNETNKYTKATKTNKTEQGTSLLVAILERTKKEFQRSAQKSSFGEGKGHAALSCPGQALALVCPARWSNRLTELYEVSSWEASSSSGRH